MDISCILSCIPVAFTNGSSEHYGQVHLASGGRLVPVCNSGWNDPDAKVVCREMGYGGGAAFQNLILYNGRIFPPTYETINYVSCRGDESSLAACSFRVLNYGCSGNGAGTYAMAVCYNGTEDVDTLNREPMGRLPSMAMGWEVNNVKGDSYV